MEISQKKLAVVEFLLEKCIQENNECISVVTGINRRMSGDDVAHDLEVAKRLLISIDDMLNDMKSVVVGE